MAYTGKLTLRNDFHQTEATVLVKNGVISPRSLKRARKKLCGMRDCCCGGIRGTQDMVIDLWFGEQGEYARVSNP